MPTLRPPSPLRWIGLAVLCAIIVALGFVPRYGARLLRGKLAFAAARYGARATVEAIRIGWGRVELFGLRIDGQGPDPIFYARHTTATVSLTALWTGHVHVQHVLVEQPVIFAVIGGPADNLTAVREAYRNRKKDGGSGGLTIDEIKIYDGKLEARETTRGAVSIDRFDATIRPDDRAELDVLGLHAVARVGATADLDEGHIEAKLVGRTPAGLPEIHFKGGVLTPFAGLRLGAIAGSLAPDDTAPGRVRLDIAGSFGDRTEPAWSARGSIDPLAQQGRITVAAERFKLGQLSNVMGGSRQGAVETRSAEVDLRLDVGYADHVADFAGRVHLSGLTIDNPRLGPHPVRNVGFDAKAKGRVELANKKLELEAFEVDYRGVHAKVTGAFEKVGPLPKFHASATVDPVPCQTVLDALPAELTPFLQGFRVAGEFSTDLHAGIDLSDLTTPVDLGGKVGIEGCRVTQSPAWGSASRLERSFEQTVEYEPGKWMTFLVGPENTDFVPFADISPHLVNSIMTTEDSGFWKHKGFIPSEFRSALQQNLQRGYFRLGASSITMQMVKNVLLSREKTLSRKLQEMFLTWYLEHQLGKQRILEIYFNVIEFGPGIYGIGRAAHHYFGKSAHDLTPREAAYFSSILPNPKRRYVQFCHANGQVDAKWDLYLKRILRRMHERGRLTDDEFKEAIAQPLAFSRTEAVSEHECMAIVKRTTGGPPWPQPK
ncbi:MAG: transglycosylase domain-containing protein [Polyangia bacterium]